MVKESEEKRIKLLEYMFRNQAKRFSIRHYSITKGIPRTTIYDMLGNLWNKGLVTKIQEGRYEITKQGIYYFQRRKIYNLEIKRRKLDTQKKIKYNETLLKLNNLCYFCDFNLIIERHHIIPRKDGGSNKETNKIGLCPNHHHLVHHEDYCLYFSNGLYYILNKSNKNKVKKPSNTQIKFKRKLPIISFKKAILNDSLWVDLQ